LGCAEKQDERERARERERERDSTEKSKLLLETLLIGQEEAASTATTQLVRCAEET
jgi:hypothetical protein